MTKVDQTISNLNGIIGVANIPFDTNNEIDLASIRRYVRHSIDCGVVGFLVPAIAAEVGKLSVQERCQLVGTVVDEVNGKVIVIGGASSPNLDESLGLISTYESIGCDGILVNIPFSNHRVYSESIHRIGEKVSTFLMIQDWDFGGFGIPVDTIVELFENVDVFKCLKVEVVPAGIKYTQVLEATDRKLHVSGGWASSQMIEALDRGVNAFMPTILPDIFNAVFRLHANGKRAEARALFDKLVAIIVFSRQHVDISIHFNKRMVHRQGLFSTSRVRQPILPFDKYHEKVTEELIEQAIQLSEECRGLDLG